MNSHLSKAKIRELVNNELANHQREGIKFAIAGKTGFGKTTTLNVLFDVDMKTSGAEPATTHVQELSLEILNAQSKKMEIKNIPLTILDLPGLGEGTKNDHKNFDIYSKLLPQVDVVLWTLAAPRRDYALDIQYISDLIKLHPELKQRIIVGVNFIDNLSPQDWKINSNQPSQEQNLNLEIVLTNIGKLIHEQCGIETNITVPYSAKQAWGLENLFLNLMKATPEGKRWVFADLKPDYREAFLSRIPEKFRSVAAEIYPSN
jgi:uncharacterized protein